MTTSAEIAHELLTGECALGYYIKTKSEYYDEKYTPENQVESIMVGVYGETGGTMGEFEFAWEKLGKDVAVRMKAFDDSWQTFAFMPDLFVLLDKAGRGSGEKCISPEDFVLHLKETGWRDLTRYSTWENGGFTRTLRAGCIPACYRPYMGGWSHYAALPDGVTEDSLKGLTNEFEVRPNLLLTNSEENAMLAKMKFS